MYNSLSCAFASYLTFRPTGHSETIYGVLSVRKLLLRDFAVNPIYALFHTSPSGGRRLHEAGHILYGHNFKNISPDDELEANTFMASCLKDYRYKTKIIVVFSLFILAVIIVKNGDLTSQAPRSSQLSQLDSSCNYYSGASIPADYVVITGTGDKYHRPNCQYVQGKTNLLTLATEEAMQLGKQPCKVCNPDR